MPRVHQETIKKKLKKWRKLFNVVFKELLMLCIKHIISSFLLIPQVFVNMYYYFTIFANKVSLFKVAEGSWNILSDS